MAKMRKRKKNPENIYRKAQRDLAGGKNKPAKGPTFKFGKVKFPSTKERQEAQKKFLDALVEVDQKVKDPTKKQKLKEKLNKNYQSFRKSMSNRLKKLQEEEARMMAKGYIKEGTNEGEKRKSTLKAIREEITAEKKAIRDSQSIEKFGKKLLASQKKNTKKVLTKEGGKKKKTKKKKTSKRKASGKKSSYKRKRNPIQVLDNPMAIEVLDNPKRKKSGSKKKKSSGKKKVSKKKSSKRKSSKKSSKKSSGKKKVSKKKSSGKKKSSKRKVSKRKGSKRKGSKKKSALALEAAPTAKKSHKKKSRRKSSKRKSKAMKASKYKKGKHKRKSNPGEFMASKFEQITKHDVMEAAGLATGGVALKLYNQHAKSFIVNLPGIKNIYQMIPSKATPLFDGVVDVLLAAALGHGISKISKGNAKAEAIGKGIIGAAVVSFSMKATQSIYAVAGKQMNGFVAVPSMDGIIAVPEMEGIIAVPEMQGFGQADFGQLDSDADFGAILATPEMEGMGEADFGEFEYNDEGADF